jgi:hypothetical protein
MITQLPVNGAFYINIDEHDIAHLGRSSKVQSSEDCSRGLMVFLYHGSKGTETIVGEQFIPLYKLFSKKIKSQLAKSLPIEKIFLHNDLPSTSPSQSPSCYSIEAEMDIRQSLNLTFVSAHLYSYSAPPPAGDDQDDGSQVDCLQVESISQSVNLIAHLVTWNGQSSSPSLLCCPHLCHRKRNPFAIPLGQLSLITDPREGIPLHRLPWYHVRRLCPHHLSGLPHKSNLRSDLHSSPGLRSHPGKEPVLWFGRDSRLSNLFHRPFLSQLL